MNLLWLILGCNGCASCTPSPPVNENDDSRPLDTSEDSGDTDSGDTEDTGPPPPCTQPEVEPNNFPSEYQSIEMEKWACGTLHQGDFDYFGFEMPEPGWIKVDVDAATLGSAAAPILRLYSDEVHGIDLGLSVDSTDPIAIFPVANELDWTASLNDVTSANPGDDYHYKLLATVTKPPVTWTDMQTTGAEVLPWNANQNVTEISEGMVILGHLEEDPVWAGKAEEDWFVYRTPPGRKDIEVHVTAFSEGSPMNPTLKLYDDDERLKKIAYVGDSTYDRDPILEYTSYGDETWYLVVREFRLTAYGHALWYTIEVRVVD